MKKCYKNAGKFKTMFLVALFSISYLDIDAQTLTKSLFIDFGINTGAGATPAGVSTSSPDANGNYWNNFANWATVTDPAVSLMNSTNEATGFSISLTRVFSSSASGYSNGGFTVSDAGSPVKNLPAEFKIPTAGYDFFYTSSTSSTTGPQLKFSGLNPNRQYKFKIFASRVNTTTRITSYSLAGATTVTGNLQTSGTDLGGTGFHLNNSSILTLANVYPASNGELLLSVYVNSGGGGYINFLKIEEYAPLLSLSSGSTVNADSYTDAQLANNSVEVNSGEFNLNRATTNVYAIKVAPNAKLTLASGATLSTQSLTLESDATGTATFVDNNTNSPQANISGTVKQYVSAGRNWYMSIPLADAAKSALNRGTSVVTWNESAGTVGAWEEVSASGNALEKLRGYIQVATSTPAITGTTGTVNFSGTLNTGELSINTLTRTEGKKGFNLVGNPYPSYLNWNLVSRTNILPTIWYRTKVGSVYKFYTYLNGDGALEEDGVTVPAGVSNLIPPMQAFWVRVENVGTGSITVNNNMRAHKDASGNIMKAPRKSNNQILRLQVSNGTNDDETVIYFNENARNDFDSYDAPKMLNNSIEIPDIYTTIGDEKLVINGLNQIPYDTEIPLGFNAGKNGRFTISNIEMTNFETGSKAILKDKLKNTEVDLTNEQSYGFDVESANITNRFSLVFKAPTAPTSIDSNFQTPSVIVYKNANNSISVYSAAAANNVGIITLYNSVGQALASTKTKGATTLLNQSLSKGVYMVTVDIAGAKTTKKLTIN